MKKKNIHKNVVVVYGNKIQTINLSNLTPLEHNLLFSFFKELRYKDEHTFLVDQIEEMMNNVSKNKNDLYKIINGLPNKFLGTNILIENEKTKMFVNLFSYLKINYNDKDDIHSVSIGVNKDFSYLFRDVKNNFMSFNLLTFKSFSSVYTKTIYRYINQYSSIGKWMVSYDKFIELLNIPRSYGFKLINYRIIKPSIKELSKTIEGLDCGIIKEKENGKVVIKYIVFTFISYKNSVVKVIAAKDTENIDMEDIF